MTSNLTLSSMEARLIRLIGNGISLGKKGDNRVCIITYHRILEHHDPLLDYEPDVQAFRWQMETLSQCFNVLPLSTAIEAIRTHRVPPRAVCITFDDGYRSCHDLALPILQELCLPATVFVTTGCLDQGNMWNDRIVEAVRGLPPGLLDLTKVGLGIHGLRDTKDRKRIINHINDCIKYLPPESRDCVINYLEEITGRKSTSSLMLTREMIARLADSGIEIGGHTVNHPILTRLSDSAARAEIIGSKIVLEKIIGKPLGLFAYPNGKVGMDFDERHVKMVQEAGYDAAFTTSLGAAHIDHEHFQIPRGRPWDTTPLRFSMRLLSWMANIGISSVPVKTHNEHAYKSKNALLIAFHFPPQAESSGIQRTLSFSKYLGAQNWLPSILSANPIAYEQKNASQLPQIPKNVKVKRAWVIDTKRHLGMAGRYPEILALPDRWISWWLAAVPLGLSIIRKARVQVIWTTYPIATAHLIGLTLKYLTQRPWIADFRDPMTQDNYPKSLRQRRFFRWIEKHTITRCDIAVFTTYSARDTYARRYPEQDNNKFVVIENGYDEDGFEHTEKNTEATPSRIAGAHRITLLHSGVLYTNGRDPSAFFTALVELRRKSLINAASFQVILRAPGEINYFKELVLKFDIEDIVNILPPVSYREALAEMQASDALLVFQGTPFNTQIPAKIYEYFRARKPIFGLLDPQGETARVLTSAGFHDMADMTSSISIQETLSVFLQRLKTGTAHTASDELVSNSSRKHRARQLAEIFDQVTHHAR